MSKLNNSEEKQELLRIMRLLFMNKKITELEYHNIVKDIYHDYN